MGRKRSTAPEWPHWFWQIPDQLRNRRASAPAGQKPEPIVLSMARNEAVNSRQRWHHFRRWLAEQGHPDAAVALTTMLSIDGKGEHAQLIIKDISYIGAQLGVPEPTIAAEPLVGLEGLGSERSDEVPSKVQAAPDRAEELVKSWMGATDVAAASIPPSPPDGQCAHEWDALGTRCVKCGAPTP